MISTNREIVQIFIRKKTYIKNNKVKRSFCVCTDLLGVWSDEELWLSYNVTFSSHSYQCDKQNELQSCNISHSMNCNFRLYGTTAFHEKTIFWQIEVIKWYISCPSGFRIWSIEPTSGCNPTCLYHSVQATFWCIKQKQLWYYACISIVMVLTFSGDMPTIHQVQHAYCEFYIYFRTRGKWCRLSQS